MKVLHTSDWHLGKKLESFSRIEEQREVLEEICIIADREKADAVLIAGDIFDSFNPPVEAVELFYKTAKRLANGGKRPVIAIAGNHDSPDRIEAPEPLARECGLIFAGYPATEIRPFELESGLKLERSEPGFIEIKLPNYNYPLRVLSTPYANEYRLKTYLGSEDSEEELRKVLENKWTALADKYCDNKGVNVLLTHLFMSKRGEVMQEEPEGEKPILHVGGAQVVYYDNIPDQVNYTALGHLHRKIIAETDSSVIAYSGTPLAYSFAEASQSKYVLIADIKPGEKPKIKELELSSGRKVLRKLFDNTDDAVAFLNEHRNILIELKVKTDKYLTAEDRKRIYAAGDEVVFIIPEVVGNTDDSSDYISKIDLTKDISELFKDYFKHANGQEPNDRIMDLFNEVLAEEEEL